jgi:hypothetical protein
VDLVEHGSFIGTQVDDAVGDDGVRPAVLDRQVLGEAAPELDLGQAEQVGGGASLGKHLVGHVDPDDSSRGADEMSGDEAVEAGARVDVDDVLTGCQLPQPERTWSRSVSGSMIGVSDMAVTPWRDSVDGSRTYGR